MTPREHCGVHDISIRGRKHGHVADPGPAASTRIRRDSLNFTQFLEMALDFLLGEPWADTKDLKGVVDLVVHPGACDLPAEVRKGGPAGDDKRDPAARQGTQIMGGEDTDFKPGKRSLEPRMRLRWAIHGPHSHGTALLADRERDGKRE